MTSRDHSLKAVLGDSYEQIRNSKVLLVGAGGIGCELLKDLILLGYGEIHVVDLDTIDLSNLNRQFLFRHKDIKQPKASTAVNAVTDFNFFQTKLVPYQASIYETDTFPLQWFKQFDLIFNALDNIDARSYINKIALFVDKVVMESGTTGTSGQAAPTFPYKTECYDCSIRETPKTFPVCTIRSTPSQPIHCIHWAKSFLFTSLFGEEDDTPQEVNPEGKDHAALGTDNEEEIKNLVVENNELMELRRAINDDDFAIKVIEKVFIKDIAKLVRITDLWKTRTAPTPLDYESIKPAVESLQVEELGTGQSQWTIEQNVKLLIDSIQRLQSRIKSGKESEIEFDKDDEDTLDFVVSSANIRSFIFQIPIKSKFDIKSIAGNIIPAIATTNAIIAGFSSLISLKQFGNTRDESIAQSRGIFTTSGLGKFISPSSLNEPNPKCAVCSIPRGIINVDNNKQTIQQLIDALIEKYGYDEEISISIGSKLLYDVDFDDNKDKTLVEMGVSYGVHLSVGDENDVKQTVEFYVELNQDGVITLPELDIPDKPVPVEEEEESDGDDDELEMHVDEIDDDDLQIIEPGVVDDASAAAPSTEKRKSGSEEPPLKKIKIDENVVEEEVIELD